MVQAEMLPGTYSFALTYNGTHDQKSYTVIEPNPNNHANALQTVYFHTMLVNVWLQAHNGSILSIPNNGSASYYAGGWHAITTLNVNNPAMVTAEMLPGTYSFAVTYNGTHDQDGNCWPAERKQSCWQRPIRLLPHWPGHLHQ